MFNKHNWTSKNGRHHDVWASLFNFDVKDIDCTRNLKYICNDLKKCFESTSSNPNHRLSLRLSAGLVEGTARLYKLKAEQLIKDYLRFLNVCDAEDEIDEEEIIGIKDKDSEALTNNLNLLDPISNVESQLSILNSTRLMRLKTIHLPVNVPAKILLQSCNINWKLANVKRMKRNMKTEKDTNERENVDQRLFLNSYSNPCEDLEPVGGDEQDHDVGDSDVIPIILVQSPSCDHLNENDDALRVHSFHPSNHSSPRVQFRSRSSDSSKSELPTVVLEESLLDEDGSDDDGVTTNIKPTQDRSDTEDESITSKNTLTVCAVIHDPPIQYSDCETGNRPSDRAVKRLTFRDSAELEIDREISDDNDLPTGDNQTSSVRASTTTKRPASTTANNESGIPQKKPHSDGSGNDSKGSVEDTLWKGDDIRESSIDDPALQDYDNGERSVNDTLLTGNEHIFSLMFPALSPLVSNPNNIKIIIGKLSAHKDLYKYLQKK